MPQLLRYLWDDTYTYAATAGLLIGSLIAYIPKIVPTMPPSYGYWIAGTCAAVVLYRTGKAAILLRFGKHTEARIHDTYHTISISKLTYSSKHDRTIAGKWQTSNQHSKGELTIAYWESHPSFHIAYWNYNTVNRTQSEKPLLERPSEKTNFPQDFS